MKTPRNGRMITKMHHSALTHPPRSGLRKMSMKTVMRIQIQMKNKKKYSIDKNTPPSG